MYETKTYTEKSNYYEKCLEMEPYIEEVEKILSQFGTLEKDTPQSWYAGFIWILKTNTKPILKLWIEWSDWRFEIKVRKGENQTAKDFIQDYENNFKLCKFTDFIKMIEDKENSLRFILKSFLSLFASL